MNPAPTLMPTVLHHRRQLANRPPGTRKFHSLSFCPSPIKIEAVFVTHDTDHPGESSDGGGTELAPGVRVPAQALRFQFSRSSGPGGQNVNKLNTRAELWLPLASLTAL